MSHKLTLGILIALVVTHFCLAATFASITPYRQSGALLGLGKPTKVLDIGAPDERQHVNYVIHLLEGKGFPVFSPTDPHLDETYQSHQPPAYYLLAAAWCKVSGASDLLTKADGFKLRLLNTLIGSGTVAGVFFLALWGFKKPETALCAAAFAATIPMFVALAGAVSNDPLLILLCTWVLALCAKCLRDGWNWQQALLIGVLTGLALLTKTTAVALIPVLLLVLFLARKFPAGIDDDRRANTLATPSFAMMAAVAALALVLVGPWWARNQSLYHDPLAIKAFGDAFKGSAQKEQIVAGIEATEPGGSSEMTYWKDWVGWWTARSFFGVFGYMDIWMNERGTSFTGVSERGNAPNTLYRLMLAGTALCLIGWIWALTKPEWKGSEAVQILNGAFFLVILVLFVRFNMQYFQAQARYLYPAMGPIACGFGVGITQLLGKYRNFGFAALAFLLVCVNLFAISELPEAFSKRIEAANRLP